MLADQFIAENTQRIFLQIYRRVRNVDDAQELTQDVFIKALQSAGGVRDSRKIGHWLSRIATNTALDFVRRRRCGTSDVDLGSVRDLADRRQSTPEQAAIRTEERRWLYAGLGMLSQRERTALLLRDVEEVPAAEVARRMGCSQATVRSHIANARIKLAQARRSKSSGVQEPPGCQGRQQIPAC
jgi:RNA polymerase sigma-70 factor (ECF subfamily)